MSKLTKTLLGLTFYMLLATATSPCNGDEPSNSPEGTLEFVGRVIKSEGLFLNDRLVILYLNGREVGRSITKTGKYYIDDKPNDGLFQIIVPNEYELSEKEINDKQYKTGHLSTYQRGKEKCWGAATYINVGAGYEGLKYEYVFPDRSNLKYTAKIIYGDYGTIAKDIRECEGGTYLTDMDEVVCPLSTTTGRPEDPLLTGQTEEIKIKEVEIPVDNCFGNTTISQRYSGGESFMHEINFSIGVTAGILKRVQAKFGYSDKQESFQSIETNFTAKPKTKMIYKIAWYEVWQYGTIPIKTERETKNIPFKVKDKLVPKISSQIVSCR